MELLLPVALMLLIVWIRVEIEKENVPEMSYLAEPRNNPTWFEGTAMNISEELGPEFAKLKEWCNSPSPSGLCPELFANATWNLRKEHYLGVAIDGLFLLHMSLFNQQLGVVGNRELANFIEALPGFSFPLEDGRRHSFVRYFSTSKEFLSYIDKKDYGFSRDVPQLLGAIEVKSVAEKGADGRFTGDWEAVFHLNATGPGSLDINGATDVNPKIIPSVLPLAKEVRMEQTRIYWSGGLFMSTGFPTPTGGAIDLQSLLYAWIYNTTGAYTMPSPDQIPKCECTDATKGTKTEDFSKCKPAEALLQVLTPAWPYEGILPSVMPKGTPQGCLGRLSGILPLSIREVPMPTPAYTKDTFAQIVKSVFGLFFTLLFLWPLTRIMKCLTEDKEARINEVMKMMGLPAEAIAVGWYITYAVLWLLPAALIPAIAWTTVFEHSNKFIVFLFFWLFGVCVLTFCSFMAVFFEKAQTASVVGALIFFILYFPYAIVVGPAQAASAKLLVSLCPPVALSFGATMIAELESAGQGVQWGNLGVAIDNFTMGRVLLMLVVDSALFAVLAWYLDKVFIVGFGTRQPWNFMCSKRYWHPERSSLSDERARQLEAEFDDMRPGNPRYEAVTASLAAETRTVLLRGLRKFFRTESGETLAAVQGLTLNLYSSQIFCLLGHNGAGKTTTINLLSGMLPVDDGDAIVYGKSVRQDMPSIRKILGVCPQHDVIWSKLTVQEHLEFFSAVKGVSEEQVASQVRATIADVSLQEKQHALAGTLSGGQKRRLSAAIALIGGSKVVFLDEPSSGVDPFSRRELWDCLKTKKKNRTVIMTTHFMEEAEELGDRIAIMAAGQIKCVGSSLFLKAQYGVGYTVTITKRPEASSPDAEQARALRSLVTSKCPGAQLLSDAGTELVFRMAMEESRAFPSLFEEFESSPERLGVDFFSVSVTTLEEVFLRVGQDHFEADQTIEERLEQRSFTRQLSRQNSEEGVGGAAGSSLALGSSSSPPSDAPSGRVSAPPAGVVAAGAPPKSSAGILGAEVALTPLPHGDGGIGELRPHNTLFFSHVHALLSKRYSNAKRDRKAWCCQLAVPLTFVLLALCTLKFTNIGSYPAVPLHLSMLPGDQTLAFSGADDQARAFMEGFGSTVEVLDMSNASSDVDFDKYLLSSYFRSDAKERYGAIRFQSVPQFNLGDNGTAGSRSVDGWEVANFKRPGLVYAVGETPQSQMWPNGFTVPVGSLWKETVMLPALGDGETSAALAQAPPASAGRSSGGSSDEAEIDSKGLALLARSSSMGHREHLGASAAAGATGANGSADRDGGSSEEIVVRRRLLASQGGHPAEAAVKAATPPITVPMHELNNRMQVDLFWNSSARDAVLILYHELHDRLLTAALGADVRGNSSVKVYNQPFPLTAGMKDLADTQTSIFLALGFAFIPASYGAFVVLERENNSKHLQIVSGVNFVSYWLATWMWDVINYMLPAALSIAMIAAFGIDQLVNAANLPWTILVVFLYGTSCTSFTYMFTFLFKSHSSAQNLLLVMYLFTGGILEIVNIVLQLVPSTQDTMRNVLIFIFRLLPNFCLADALTNLITRTNPLAVMTLNCPATGCPASGLKILGWDLIYMGLGSIVWFLITLLLELALNTPRFRARFDFGGARDVALSAAHTTGQGLDPDVWAETQRVRSGDADSDAIVVKGLRKVFPGRAGAPPKVAVQNMHFGVPQGQCFGYLGMNGAGKTSTMKILTGEELCTSGEATLGGFDIKTEQSQVRQLLGYCPQFDALIPTLTAREHLTLFARIKGVQSDRIKSYVEAMLDSLTLTPYADRQARTFSGGTKRKLSLGIALIGNPPIVFLDEPTTGVDPESRRFMWTLISTTMRGRSVILTTHSMDECEALCGRIGIMVNGELVCLGSVSHLKAVHGAGYQFDVAFKAGVDTKAAFTRLISFAAELFSSGVEVMEGTAGSSRIKLRLPKGGLPISAIFRQVEESRERLSLAEYSVSETTLEQIFIHFAKHQVAEDAAAAASSSGSSAPPFPVPAEP